VGSAVYHLFFFEILIELAKLGTRACRVKEEFEIVLDPLVN